jgi:2-methylcitrate dehydratase PrpD
MVGCAFVTKQRHLRQRVVYAEVAASAAVARLHQLDDARTLFAQQNPAVIDQGVFHNDVSALKRLWLAAPSSPNSATCGSASCTLKWRPSRKIA